MQKLLLSSFHSINYLGDFIFLFIFWRKQIELVGTWINDYTITITQCIRLSEHDPSLEQSADTPSGGRRQEL
jgi:hypothetical protein